MELLKDVLLLLQAGLVSWCAKDYARARKPTDLGALVFFTLMFLIMLR